MTRIIDATTRDFRSVFKLMPKGISLVMVGDNRVQFATERLYENITMTYSGGKWISPAFETLPDASAWLTENY